MNVRDRLIEALSPIGYEVKLQGSYAEPEPLPETFITYFILDSPDGSYYDDQPQLTHTRIQVILYSKKMSLINVVPDLIFHSARAAGFIRDSRGRDVGYEGEHYGWMMNFITTERNS